MAPADTHVPIVSNNFVIPGVVTRTSSAQIVSNKLKRDFRDHQRRRERCHSLIKLNGWKSAAHWEGGGSVATIVERRLGETINLENIYCFSAVTSHPNEQRTCGYIMPGINVFFAGSDPQIPVRGVAHVEAGRVGV